MAVVHTGTRAYVFQCTYDGASWIDDPASLITDLQNKLRTITNLVYSQLKIANVRNSNGKKIEIEICGIEYNSKKKLTASEVDDLIDDLNTVLLEITNLTFLYIDVCSDVFRDDPTAGWPDSSWKRG